MPSTRLPPRSCRWYYEPVTLTIFSLGVAGLSMLAGLVGALTGLGGGVLLVPLLTLGFGVNVRYAAGASLVSVIATSSGAASTYVRDGYTNIRIGVFLEVATTIGAVGGALLAARLPTGAIALIFGLVLLGSALTTATHEASNLEVDGGGYRAQRVPLAFLLMTIAGVVSRLLGIGSGALKVLAMDRVMRLPFKVSTTTSNFMIGVTAAASAGIYLRRGYINPAIVWPVMLGVLAGAFLGARVLRRAPVTGLRSLFKVVVVVLAIEMIIKGLR